MWPCEQLSGRLSSIGRTLLWRHLILVRPHPIGEKLYQGPHPLVRHHGLTRPYVEGKIFWRAFLHLSAGALPNANLVHKGWHDFFPSGETYKTSWRLKCLGNRWTPNEYNALLVSKTSERSQQLSSWGVLCQIGLRHAFHLTSLRDIFRWVIQSCKTNASISSSNQTNITFKLTYHTSLILLYFTKKTQL